LHAPGRQASCRSAARGVTLRVSAYLSRKQDDESRAATERTKWLIVRVWKGGRVVEGTGLENRQARKGLVGSNPTPSATA
jgi:hypothetical protein